MSTQDIRPLICLAPVSTKSTLPPLIFGVENLLPPKIFIATLTYSPLINSGDSAIFNLCFCQPDANIKLKSYKVYCTGRCPALCSYELLKISLSVLRRSAAVTANLCSSIRALWRCAGIERLGRCCSGFVGIV